MTSSNGIYTFQMHWLTMVWLVALGLVLGGLLFTAGMVVGTKTTMASLGRNLGESGESVQAANPIQATAPKAAGAQAPGAPAAGAPAAGAPAAGVPTAGAQTPSVQSAGIQAAGSQPPAAAAAPTAVNPPQAPVSTAPVSTAPAQPAAKAPTTVAQSSPHVPDFLRPDLTPSLLGSEPQPVSFAPESQVLLPAGWAVQIGAFISEENADALVAELEDRGYEPYVHRMRTRGGKPLHSVRLWSFTDRKEAWLQASKFSRREALEASIIRSPTD